MLTVKKIPTTIGSMSTDSRPGPEERRSNEAVAAWLETFRSPNTAAAYRTDVGHFRAWCARSGADLFALKERDLLRYRDDCQAAGAGAATVSRRLAAIASFSTFASAAGDGSPAPHIARPPVSARSNASLLGDTDARALLAAADGMNPRTAALIRLLVLDGLKLGEVVRADAADVSGRPPRMTLSLPGREVRLHADTAKAVHAYLARRRDGPLLLNERRSSEPERLTRFGVDYVVKQAARTAGVSAAVSANSLRRRYVVAEHERGADIDQIRRNAGHADARTTRRYLPASDAGLGAGGSRSR